MQMRGNSIVNTVEFRLFCIKPSIIIINIIIIKLFHFAGPQTSDDPLFHGTILLPVLS